MIDLYYAPTPNGHKITLFLEEAELDYRIIRVDISKGEIALSFWLSRRIIKSRPSLITSRRTGADR